MSNRYGYVQSRLQARYARLPEEPLWLHLGALKELASFLEEARSTPLVQWISGLSASSDLMDMDRHLEGRLVQTIREVAGWFDDAWKPAVIWLTTLLHLPDLEHLERNGKAAEGVVSSLLLEGMQQKAGEQPDLLDAWNKAWRSRWPGDTYRNLKGMNAFADLVEKHQQAFPALPVQAAWQSRRELESRLRFYFRRHLLQPGAAFAYLALVSLMLERLRGELIKRAVCNGQVDIR